MRTTHRTTELAFEPKLDGFAALLLDAIADELMQAALGCRQQAALLRAATESGSHE